MSVLIFIDIADGHAKKSSLEALTYGAKVAEQLEIQAKYHGYIERQYAEIEKQKRHEDTELSIDMDYNLVKGLSNEVAQKLNEHKPVSIGQASRISGVTPAAISLLLVYLKKHGKAA